MRLRWHRNRVGFDEAMFGTMAAGMEKLVAAGLDESDATGVAADALMRVAGESAPRVAVTLQQRSPRMLRTRERHTKAFNRVLRVYWGRALGRYLAICVAAEEIGKRFHDRLAGAAVENRNYSFEALTGLYARACRTAFEIHHALAGGFPMGALARCRTLHEIAVIMMVLSEFGEEHTDLAERFLLHEVVQNWKDAKIYQEHCAALGTEPFTDDEMDDMERDRQELLERFGTNYRHPYGWASGVGGLVNPTFADLEKLVGVAHLRGHYGWANHEVHADSKGWQLNVFERGNARYQETGPTHFGLAEPASWSLNSLQQCIATLVLSTEDVSPMEIIACKTTQHLIDEATDVFETAEVRAEESDERVLRLRPWQRRLWLLWCSYVART